MERLRLLSIGLIFGLLPTACDGGGSGDETSATDGESETGTGTGEDTGTGGDSGSGTDTGGELVVPDVYAFESRFEAGASSVSYGGQAFRQVLIASLSAEMSLIQQEIDEGAVFEAGVVAARLSFYYDFDGETSGSIEHLVQTSPAPLQVTWSDVGGGSDLVSKTAGNDPDPQHRDWSNGLVGWDSAASPEALVRELFETCDALAVAYSSGQIPQDPSGTPVPLWFVSAEGVDYQQLVQKFLLGAVNYSQGTDDYLDDASDNGLNADNTMSDDGDPYTALEHAWDEGFGYWGGARDYLEYTDDEVAAADGRADYQGVHDFDGDGAIDLLSEINFAASVNAAKRDRGAAALGAATDFSAQTMDAFLRGRAIITAANGALDETRFASLQAERDLAVDGWERALAATAIHYFNDTLQDMSSDAYDFAGHAKHWSELKGFLLMLQFNPRAQVSEEDLRNIHDSVGIAPVLPTADEADDYAARLVTARDSLADAYGFDAALVGDANGENGW